MATKQQVLALHKKHPNWTAPEIAKKLRCDPAYVRATAQRNSLTLLPGYAGMTPAAARRLKLRYRLGLAALAAGLTVKQIQGLAA